MTLSNLAISSNEKREQRIMRLRNAFNNQKYVTVASAAQGTGYAYSTVLKWCKDGNIPMLDSEGEPVVPIINDNKPKWL